MEVARGARLRINLRRSLIDGLFCCAMVGAGELYLAAFALQIGLPAVISGLVPTLPMLAGAVLALLAPRCMRAVGSLRRWVWVTAAIQGLAFVPLSIGAAMGTLPGWMLFACAFLYWSAGLSCASGWNTWITTLVPASLRAHYFGRRTRALQAAQLAALLCAGLLLRHCERSGRELQAFAWIFGAAALARWASAAMLAAHDEPVAMPAGYRLIPRRKLLKELGSQSYGRVIAFLFVLQVGVQFASPYFTPFMRQELGLDYATFMALIATAFVGKICCLPAFGRLARARGVDALMKIGAFGVVPVAIPWMFSSSLLVLFPTQFLAGAVWSAVELAIYLSFFERAKEIDRASILSVYNLTNALAYAIGSLAGGALLAGLGSSHFAYLWVFGTSTALRLFAPWLWMRSNRPVPRDPALVD